MHRFRNLGLARACTISLALKGRMILGSEFGIAGSELLELRVLGVWGLGVFGFGDELFHSDLLLLWNRSCLCLPSVSWE